MAAAEPFVPNQPTSSLVSNIDVHAERQAAKWIRQLNPIRQVLWHQHNAVAAHEQLAELKATLPVAKTGGPTSKGACQAYWELVGYASWQRKNYRKAAEAFDKANNSFLTGYVRLLSGDVPKALKAFSSLHEPSEDAPKANHWGYTLLGLVTGQLQSFPTILQMRQHLERDVAHLAAAGQQGMVNNLCQYAPILIQVNTEAYKFIGRGLLNSGYTEQALGWLLMAHQININDPELYYHLGEAYVAQNQPQLAKRSLNQCLMMTDMYPPATVLLAKLAKE